MEVRLLRRLLRWELKEPGLFSSAAAYDCTMITQSNIHQNVAFFFKDEFEGIFVVSILQGLNFLLGIERTLLGLRLVHYPNERYVDLKRNGQQIPCGHPSSLEPPQTCGQDPCAICVGISKCREFVNACFVAQHQENDDDSVDREF